MTKYGDLPPFTDKVHDEVDADGATNGTTVPEWVTLPEHISYLGPLLRFIACVHTAIAFSLMVAYYFLKVLSCRCVPDSV